MEIMIMKSSAQGQNCYSIQLCYEWVSNSHSHFIWWWQVFRIIRHSTITIEVVIQFRVVGRRIISRVLRFGIQFRENRYMAMNL